MKKTTRIRQPFRRAWNWHSRITESRHLHFCNVRRSCLWFFSEFSPFKIETRRYGWTDSLLLTFTVCLVTLLTSALVAVTVDRSGNRTNLSRKYCLYRQRGHNWISQDSTLLFLHVPDSYRAMSTYPAIIGRISTSFPRLFVKRSVVTAFAIVLWISLPYMVHIRFL